MKHSPDLFGGELPPSFAPHLDPARVVSCRVREDEDRDHVGVEAIGRFGNNARVWVFEVLGARDVVLYAESCCTPEAANELLEHHEAMLEAHRQTELFS